VVAGFQVSINGRFWVSTEDKPLPVSVPPALNPFALADSAGVAQTLSLAGFAEVCFSDVSEPVYYGVNVADALDRVRSFALTRSLLHAVEPASAERAVRRLRDTLGAHVGVRGIWFDSRAWIVTAVRR
jgi:hypothetical protein